MDDRQISRGAGKVFVVGYAAVGVIVVVVVAAGIMLKGVTSRTWWDLLFGVVYLLIAAGWFWLGRRSRRLR